MDEDAPHSVIIPPGLSAACGLWTMPSLRHSSPPWCVLLPSPPVPLSPFLRQLFLCPLLGQWPLQEVVWGICQSAVSLNELTLSHDFQTTTSAQISFLSSRPSDPGSAEHLLSESHGHLKSIVYTDLILFPCPHTCTPKLLLPLDSPILSMA